MSLLSRLFPARAAAPSQGGTAQAPGQWRSLLIPAVDQPYSNRALEVAFRLAQGTDARIQLAYLIEVPARAPTARAACPATWPASCSSPPPAR